MGVSDARPERTRDRRVTDTTATSTQRELREEQEVICMAISDNFTTLKEQVDRANRTITDSMAKDEDDLYATVDQARKDADEHAAQLRAKSQEATEDVERSWHEVGNDWDDHVKRLRQRVDAKKAAHDAKVAESDAEWAEADALDAISFASAAIEEAQYAVLDALLARKKAEATAAAV
jgi:hypothetical protein